MNKKHVVILFYPLIEKGEIFPNIPWALLYLERVIRSLDIEVILLDERLEKNIEEIIKKYQERILFTGVSVMIGHQITGAVSYTQLFRSISNRPVLWGGWFPTILPEMILKDGYADYICEGQGEIPFKQFTEKMLLNEDVTNIIGIGSYINKKLVTNKNLNFTNPDSFPKINLDIIDINKLIDVNGIDTNNPRSVDYIATAGCPYKCKFCNAVHIFNRKWFHKIPDQIINDLIYLKEKANVTHIDFRDDNFFGNRSFILSFCYALIESGISITWEANVHLGFLIRNFNDTDLELIYKSGCRQLRIGAESGDQEVLDLIKKEIKVSEIYTTVRFLKKHKIKTRFLTMACFPLNPKKDFWNTVKLIGRSLIINPELDPRLRFFVPVPKTELYELSIKKGFVLPYTTGKMMDFFTQCFTYHYIAPWNNKKYLKHLNTYSNFYFLWINPKFYRTFNNKIRPLAFILNLLLYVLIYIRFKTGFYKFTFEASLLMWLNKYSFR